MNIYYYTFALGGKVKSSYTHCTSFPTTATIYLFTVYIAPLTILYTLPPLNILNFLLLIAEKPLKPTGNDFSRLFHYLNECFPLRLNSRIYDFISIILKNNLFTFFYFKKSL